MQAAPAGMIRFLKVVCLNLAWKLQESGCSPSSCTLELRQVLNWYYHAEAVQLGERMVLQDLGWKVNLVTPMSYMDTVVAVGVNCWEQWRGDANKAHVGEWLLATTHFYVSVMHFGGDHTPLSSLPTSVRAPTTRNAFISSTHLLRSGCAVL